MIAHVTVRYAPRHGELATTRWRGEFAAEKYFPTREAADHWAEILIASGGQVFDIEQAPTSPLEPRDVVTLINLLDRALEHHAAPGSPAHAALQEAVMIARLVQPGQ